MKRYWLILFLVTLVGCQSVTPAPNTPLGIEQTIVPSPVVPVKFELHPPEAIDLLAMIDSVLLMERGMTYSNDVSSIILEHDPYSLHRMIGNDFEKYYLDGFPDVHNFVMQSTHPWEMESFADLGSIGPILQISLLQFINNHQDVLESGSSIELPNISTRVFSMDLDGDGNLEWLIGERYQEYNLENWFLINKQQDGLYHFIKKFDFGWPGVWNSGTEIVIDDLTGDGNDEIIRISYSYLAGRDTGSIDVYTWDDYQISLIEKIYLPGTPPPYGEISKYVIEDFNEDGVAEIRVDSPQFRRFGCQWIKSSVYYLSGRNPDVEVIGDEIPQTDECLIAKALESDTLTEQVKLYQEAISKFSAETTPLDELVWLRLQLAMAYAAGGDDKKANSQLDLLRTMEGDGEFLQLVKSELDINMSPMAYCDSLYSTTQSRFWGESIGSEIDINLTHYAYPVDYSPIADLVCPFPTVLHGRLENLKIPVSESPIDLLISKGYPFEWTQTIDWDSDSLQEWLGILQFDLPVLIYLDGNENWEIETFVLYSTSNPSNFETAIYEPADDTETKIFILFNDDGRYCSSPDTEKQLVSITPATLEYDRWFTCDSLQYSLESDSDIEFALDEFSKPYSYEIEDSPDWYYLPEFIEDSSEQKSILNLVNELENKVISQNDSSLVSNEISMLMDSLPADDSAAQLLLARLHYLLGLNYELSGQEKLAVETYLELIGIYPQSLWAQYARIRIQPVK